MDLYKLARRRFHSMYSRCYRDESKYAERRAYSDCEICFEWLNYTNYTDWFICNWYEVKSGSQMQVDKDIISPGNREYSPETCIIVPSYVNTYFTGSVNNPTAGV